MTFARLAPLACLLALPLLGCGSGSVAVAPDDAGIDASAEGAVDASAELPAAFTAAGFTVGQGGFEMVDLSACCAAGSSCFGNNPSSPYGTYRLPRAPGQTVANPGERADQTSTRWLLREDEAIVWVGTLPPRAQYFGFTNYLFSRPNPTTGARRAVFASLDETLNQQIVRHDGPAGSLPSGHRAALVHAADSGTVARVKAALVAGGFPEGAIDVLPLDAVTSHPGLDASADDYGVLFRVALFDDRAAGDAWLASPPATIYRLTPTTPVAPGSAAPYGLPTPRPKGTTAEDPALSTALDGLRTAILTKYASTHAPTAFTVDEGMPDPYACIAGSASCAGDNRDALYPRTNAFRWLEGADDFLIVYGVDHSKTGKALYTSASVYALDNLVGVASVTSADWSGSATDYIPSDPAAPKLFAWKIARNCGGDPHCLQVKDGDCPSGMTPGQLAAIAFRVYVEPSTSTAPDPATLIRERVIRFAKK